MKDDHLFPAFKLFKNPFLFLLLLLITILLPFCIEKIPINQDSDLLTDINIEVTPAEGQNRTTNIFYIGESIVFSIKVSEPGLIDSLAFGIIIDTGESITETNVKTVNDSIIIGSAVKDTNNFTIAVDQPDTVLLVGIAHLHDSCIIDTFRLYIIENIDINTAPVIALYPNRNYAAQSLPCSLKISVTNEEAWQEITLSIPDSTDSILFINDTSGIWTPCVDDSVGAHDLAVTATDNSAQPTSSTARVTITLIGEGEVPPKPENLRVIERSEDSVVLVWDEESLSDGYIVYRSLTSDTAGAWDSIASTKDTTFTDTTETVYFYKLTADNYFGSSESSEMVFAADTFHYRHVVCFKTGESLASENDPLHTVTLQVSHDARIPITVWLSASGKPINDGDILLETKEAVIEEGKTTTAVQLKIMDDNEKEEPETLTVTIDSVSSGYAAGVLQHMVVIADNDTFYTVSYNGNDAQKGVVPQDNNIYKRGASVTVSGNTGNLEISGFTFTGWNTKADSNEAGYVSGATFTMNSEDVVLYAQWTKNPTYTVSYNGNGNSAGEPPVDDNNYEKGNKATVKAPGGLVKTGYSFTIWNTMLDGSGTDWEVNSEITIGSDNITLYAQWSKNSYTLSYDGNGNSVGEVPEAITTEYQNSLAISGNTDSLGKTGFVFLNWNSKVDGSGDTYTVDTTILMIAADLTLFAQWTPDKFSITYNGNGKTSGSVPAETSCYFGSEFSISGNIGTLVKTGHSFTGWNSTFNGSGTAFPADTTIVMEAADLVLFAQWEVKNYTVTCFGNNNSSGNVPDAFDIAFGDTVIVPGSGSLEKTGHSFNEWNTLANGKGTAYQAGKKFVMDTMPVTLYAQWEKNVYSVTYNGNGNTDGTPPPITNHEYNSTVIISGDSTLERTGYTFVGWDTLADGSSNDYLVGSETFVMGAGNDTLYARWQPWKVSVSFETKGGSNINDTSVSYGDQLEILTNPTKDRYNFIKWCIDENLTKAFDIKTKITTPLTLYAEWSAKDYNLIFDKNDPEADSTMEAQSFTFGSESELDLNKFLKTGWQFIGWAAEPTGKNEYKDGAMYKMLTEGDTLYAMWERRQFHVSFNTNDGSPIDDKSVLYGERLVMPDNPTKEKKRFKRWCTTENLTTEFNPDTRIIETITLYAHWTPVFKVAYYINGGEGSVPTDNNEYAQGEPATVQAKPENLVKTGHNFTGWARAETNGKKYQKNDTLLIGSSDVKLYAQWAANTYNLVFDKNDPKAEDTMNAQSFYFGSTNILSDNKFTKTGNTFAGWATSSTGKSIYGDGVNYTMNTEGATLYATWSPIEYFVTYNGNDENFGELPPSKEVKYGEPVTVANHGNLRKDCHTFSLWNTAAKGTGTDYKEGSLFTMGDKNITLYAQWEHIEASAGPTSVTADPPRICRNKSTTLKVEGELHAGAQWEWFKGADCSGTQPYKIGKEITVNPTETTTYSVRAGGCGVYSECKKNVTVEVVGLSVLSGIINSYNWICKGKQIVLKVEGNSSDGYWQWYSGKNTDEKNKIGTGESLVDSPNVTTDYIVRKEGGTCGISNITKTTTVYVYDEFKPGYISGGKSPICYDDIPEKMSVNPSGGSGGYSYQWFYRDGTSAPTGAPGELISGATDRSYNPSGPLTTTRTYRCKVTDDKGCGSGWTEEGKTVVVRPKFNPGNIKEENQTICYNNVPRAMSVVNTSGGSESYTYQWFYRDGDNENYKEITRAIYSSYDPQEPLTTTRTYRCKVTDSKCGDGWTGNARTVVVTVVAKPNVKDTVVKDICYYDPSDPSTGDDIITTSVRALVPNGYTMKCSIDGGSNLPYTGEWIPVKKINYCEEDEKYCDVIKFIAIQDTTECTSDPSIYLVKLY